MIKHFHTCKTCRGTAVPISSLLIMLGKCVGESDYHHTSTGSDDTMSSTVSGAIVAMSEDWGSQSKKQSSQKCCANQLLRSTVMLSSSYRVDRPQELCNHKQPHHQQEGRKPLLIWQRAYSRMMWQVLLCHKTIAGPRTTWGDFVMSPLFSSCYSIVSRIRKLLVLSQEDCFAYMTLLLNSLMTVKCRIFTDESIVTTL